MSQLIRIGGDAHLDVVARRTARRLGALRSRRFASAFAGPPDRAEIPLLHRELTSFGPMGCRLRLVSCTEFTQHAERFVPNAYALLFSDLLRRRFDPWVRVTCGEWEGVRIFERFAAEAPCEPVPLPGDASWVPRAALHALAFYRFIEMRSGPGYPLTRRLAALSLLSERMIPLGTHRNEPREWQVLVRSAVRIPTYFP